MVSQTEQIRAYAAHMDTGLVINTPQNTAIVHAENQSNHH